MKLAWHDFRAERYCNIFESLLRIRTCTRYFDLPTDISFMKNKWQKAVYLTPPYFSYIFLRWNKQTHFSPLCSLVVFLSTYSGTELDTNVLHAAFIRQVGFQPKALAVPNYYKLFPSLSTFLLNLRWLINSSQRSLWSGAENVSHLSIFSASQF